MLTLRGRSPDLPSGLDAAWDTVAGLGKRVTVRTATYLARAKRVLAHEKHYAEMTDAALRAAAAEFREMFRRGRDTPADLERALGQ